MTPRVVTWSFSKHGGRCQAADCGRRIGRGDPMAKVDVGLRGEQTSGGNGQGEWWCEPCGRELEGSPAA
jgi:hypothetical protein